MYIELGFSDLVRNCLLCFVFVLVIVWNLTYMNPIPTTEVIEVVTIKKTCIKVCKKLFLVMHLSMSRLTMGKEHNTTWKAKKIWTSDLWKSGFCLNSLKVLDNKRLIIHVLHHNFDFNNFTAFSWI